MPTDDGTGSYKAFRNDVPVTVVSADETNVKFNYGDVPALLVAPRSAIRQTETIVRFRQSDGSEYKAPAAAMQFRLSVGAIKSSILQVPVVET